MTRFVMQNGFEHNYTLANLINSYRINGFEMVDHQAINESVTVLYFRNEVLNKIEEVEMFN